MIFLKHGSKDPYMVMIASASGVLLLDHLRRHLIPKSTTLNCIIVNKNSFSFKIRIASLLNIIFVRFHFIILAAILMKTSLLMNLRPILRSYDWVRPLKAFPLADHLIVLHLIRIVIIPNHLLDNWKIVCKCIVVE